MGVRNNEWLNSQGGPLIICSEKSLSDWMGIQSPNGDSDYDVACDVEDYVGIVERHGASYIVLGDEPLQSKFFLLAGVLVVARWEYCPDMATAAKIIEGLSVEELNTVEPPVKYTHGKSEKLIMFDSSLNGSEANEECQSSDLKAGIYQVFTSSVKTKEASFLIHRFVLDESHKLG